MDLIERLNEALYEKYSSYRNVELYVEQWQADYNNFGEPNFEIKYKGDGFIDLKKTLHGIFSDELLLKIAVDIGVDTPNFIPAVPVIKNVLKDGYGNALAAFEKALSEVPENPNMAVGLANTTLESIIKHLLVQFSLGKEDFEKLTLYKLTQKLLKELDLYPSADIPEEIKVIGSSLLALTKSIEDLRSNKTQFHGKDSNSYIIQDPLFAYFVVNSVTTIGLFFMDLCEYKIKSISNEG